MCGRHKHLAYEKNVAKFLIRRHLALSFALSNYNSLIRRIDFKENFRR